MIKMYKKLLILSMGLSLICHAALSQQELCLITPHKFTDPASKPLYEIPTNSRYIVSRSEPGTPDIVYYMSMPEANQFPIAILCTGSSSRNDVESVIYFHRYFLQELMDLRVGVVTLEQWGVDGMNVDVKSFMEHYTRSARLQDHITLIDHLRTNPPCGWDGTLIFIGCSEGGPLVTALTIEYANITRATINWSGAGDWNWRDELWAFVQNMRESAPWWFRLWDLVPRWMPFALPYPHDRGEYDAIMDATIQDPCTDKEFLGMTYLYHADALQWCTIAYDKIKTPYLVVAGAQDSFVESCDAFVSKAQDAGADITYMRIPDMDHYIRDRPDIVAHSFEWLERQLKEVSDLDSAARFAAKRAHSYAP